MRTVGFFQERLLGLLDRWYAEVPMDRSWIRSGPIHVYMRKSPLPDRMGDLVPALTLANLNIRQGSQGKGTLSLILRWMQDQPVSVLKVENAITPQMREIMDRPKMLAKGWWGDNETPPSYRLYLPEFKS